ncbi:MAG: hypothetical protein CUN55_02085 [Phototrophicales bacterium]|nr:MAG: hypothetical protein CUN55_02085 [Phototrophicales bacterium]
MRKYIYLLLTTLLLSFGITIQHVYAQDPYSTDTDGDGVVDAFDACPTEAGPEYNYGCPEGVTPPDADGDTFPDVTDSCPNLVGLPEYNGCPDTDGDGLDDSYDNCPEVRGVFQNYGCPLDTPRDGDRDGILDIEDRCPFSPGVVERNGCPIDYVEDIDQDGVPDYQDSCVYTDNPIGTVENSGCPEGVTPDLDYDGVADAVDACPAEYGDGPDGCLLDDDRDYIPNSNDACPDQPGDANNFGCPEGTNPADSDGDGVYDIYDRCDNEAGTNGFDCPDNDGDTIPDIDDLCPTENGDPTLGGCLAKLEASLDPNRVTINTTNATGLTELDRLVRPAYDFEVGNNNLLVVQSWNQPLTTYDLNQATIAPLGVLETRNGEIQLSADGSVLVEITYSDVGVPEITIWDPITALAAFNEIENFISVTAVAVRDDGEVIAVGTGNEPFGVTVDNPTVRLFARDGSPIGEFANLPVQPQQLALAPDGSWIAVGGPEGTFILSLPDGNTLATLPVSPFFFGSDGIDISPDGTLIALTQNDSSNIVVYETATFSERFQVETLGYTAWDAAQTVRFSPDGTLITTTGGAFVDGPPIEGSQNAFTLIDVNTGTIVYQQTSTYFPTLAVFTSDMRTLVVGTYNLIMFYGVR